MINKSFTVSFLLFRIFPLVAVNLGFALVLHAEDLFTETFEQAAQTENIGAVEGATLWTSRGNRPLLAVVNDNEGLKSGNSLRITKGLVYVSFPDVTLGVGDSLELSFRYRFAQPSQETGFPLRVGIYKDETGNPTDGNAPGYWFMSCPGQENGNAMIILEEGTDGAVGGGTDIPLLPPLFKAPGSGTVPNKLTLTVSRAAADSVDITSQINDEPPETRTDSSGKVTQFNVFAVSLATDGSTEFLLDDAKLTVTRQAK